MHALRTWAAKAMAAGGRGEVRAVVVWGAAGVVRAVVVWGAAGVVRAVVVWGAAGVVRAVVVWGAAGVVRAVVVWGAAGVVRAVGGGVGTAAAGCMAAAGGSRKASMSVEWGRLGGGHREREGAGGSVWCRCRTSKRPLEQQTLARCCKRGEGERACKVQHAGVFLFYLSTQR